MEIALAPVAYPHVLIHFLMFEITAECPYLVRVGGVTRAERRQGTAVLTLVVLQRRRVLQIPGTTTFYINFY